MRWGDTTSRFWAFPLAVSVSIAFFTNLIEASALIAIILVALSAALLEIVELRKNVLIKYLLTIFTVVVCVLLVMHKMPGFNNLSIIQYAVIKPGSSNYSFWLNYDKAIAGLILIIGFVDTTNITKCIKTIFIWSAAGVLAIQLVVFLPSYTLGYLSLSISLPEIIVIWLVSNLFITSVTEEALFRGFIQFRLQSLFEAKRLPYAPIVAVLITASLFGVAHLGGGLFLVIASTVAGIIYGAVYILSRRIETSIATHFLTNAIHIVCWTYPMAA